MISGTSTAHLGILKLFNNKYSAGIIKNKMLYVKGMYKLVLKFNLINPRPLVPPSPAHPRRARRYVRVQLKMKM